MRGAQRRAQAAHDAGLCRPLLSAAAFGSRGSAGRPPRAAEPSRRGRSRQRCAAQHRPFSALCPPPSSAECRQPLPSSPFVFSLLVPPPTLSVPRLGRSPLSSPFSLAWRSARRRPARLAAATRRVSPRQALRPRYAAQGNSPPPSQQRQRRRNRIQPDWRPGGGAGGDGGTRQRAGTEPGLPSRRGGASHLTTARMEVRAAGWPDGVTWRYLCPIPLRAPAPSMADSGAWLLVLSAVFLCNALKILLPSCSSIISKLLQKDAEQESQMRAEIQNMKQELSTISMMDEFARESTNCPISQNKVGYKYCILHLTSCPDDLSNLEILF
ncbi:tail-anchored protein insertion receptor WRB isoform X1 [Coturnix japonica]|uniref:tail-anchored protein insertion receptor WRB isoform X1 n=1 Tax=Coturnix japonica TaxID=93934 RepID=UPI0013A5D9A0|nr:tail-anchored protein insertion receptor WRB isoform X1 [Coturnix japonica]